MSPDNLAAWFLTAISSILSILVGFKTLRTKPRHDEAVPRAEMENVFSLRDEQIKTLSLRCTWLEDRVKSLEASTQKRFDELVITLNDLRVEMARLTSLLTAKAKDEI
jgi:hypothetical protein